MIFSKTRFFRFDQTSGSMVISIEGVTVEIKWPSALSPTFARNSLIEMANIPHSSSHSRGVVVQFAQHLRRSHFLHTTHSLWLWRRCQSTTITLLIVKRNSFYTHSREPWMKLAGNKSKFHPTSESNCSNLHVHVSIDGQQSRAKAWSCQLRLVYKSPSLRYFPRNL